MTPKETRVSLTPLDHLHRPNYIKISYWFPLKPGIDPKDVYSYLGRGLRRTFSRMPWLGGKVFLQDPSTPGWRPGQREIRHSPWDAEGTVPHQLVFRELDTELSYDDWKTEGLPSDAFPDEDLLDVPMEGDMEAGCDIFVAQTSFVPGGMILCMSTCHAAIDGTGMVIVMKAWADCCRAANDPSAEPLDAFPPETYDRTLLDKLWTEAGAPVPADPDEWTKGLVGLQGDAPSTATTNGDHKAEVVAAYKGLKAIHRTFYLPASTMAELQKTCEQSSQPLSISDVITALMWRGFVRARAAASRPSEAHLPAYTVLEGAINGRLDFSASLPPLYLGNVTFYNQARLPTADVLDRGSRVPLFRLAEAVRLGASRANDSASLQAAYGLLRSVASYDVGGEIKPRFRRVEGFDLLISNLLVFPVDDINFGGGDDDLYFENGGKAEALRCHLGHFNAHARCSLVLPRRPAGVEITMNLFEDEMACLGRDEVWSSYCMAL